MTAENSSVRRSFSASRWFGTAWHSTPAPRLLARASTAVGSAPTQRIFGKDATLSFSCSKDPIAQLYPPHKLGTTSGKALHPVVGQPEATEVFLKSIRKVAMSKRRRAAASLWPRIIPFTLDSSLGHTIRFCNAWNRDAPGPEIDSCHANPS